MDTTYTLIVKGNIIESVQLAQSLGLNVLQADKISKYESRLTIATRDEGVLIRWFCEDCIFTAPYPPGSLLFYREMRVEL
jgi:hypothetical protein